MGNKDIGYAGRLTSLQIEVAEYLRTFESIAEEIRPGVLSECQARMVGVVGDTFRRFESSFVPLTPPDDMKELHTALCAAVQELSKSFDLFMSKPGQQWTLAFLYSRAAFCRALYQLYDLRDRLPAIAPHFVVAGATAPVPTSNGKVTTGFIHRKRDAHRSDYTLYIPEDYSAERPLPLIVALHGGYGQGYEYIWTWVRPARSRGYAILSPKSWGDT